jgi:hypothetical protein
MPDYARIWRRLGRSGGLLLLILVVELAILVVWVLRGTAPAPPRDGGARGDVHTA